MHNENAPKEKSSLFLFVPVVLVSTYLIYVAVGMAFNYGAEHGTVEATYRGPKKEVVDEAKVFDHAKLIKQTEELIALGSKVYRSNCASCHGAEGLGNGAAGANLAVKPRNFHTPAAEWKNGASVLTMYHTLEKGLGSMPNFPALDPENKYAVIHYIHSEFMKNQYPADTAEAIASLPAPGAGGGPVKIDAYTETRVPVRYAIMKMTGQTAPQ